MPRPLSTTPELKHRFARLQLTHAVLTPHTSMRTFAHVDRTLRALALLTCFDTNANHSHHDQNHTFTFDEPMSVESCTQAICDLALRFGEDRKSEKAMVHSHLSYIPRSPHYARARTHLSSPSLFYSLLTSLSPSSPTSEPTVWCGPAGGGRGQRERSGPLPH